MDIRSIVVNVNLDTANSAALRYAISLAGQFDAELIGVAADDVSLALVGWDGDGAAADFYAMERTEIEKRLQVAQAQFHSLVPAGMKVQWRAHVAPQLQCLIDTARTADIIVTGAATSSTSRSGAR